MNSTLEAHSAQLADIFKELEILLDNSDLAECWFDWIRECEEKLDHASAGNERTTLLRKMLQSKAALSQLRTYLQQCSADDLHPQQRLDELISALDQALLREIDS